MCFLKLEKKALNSQAQGQVPKIQGSGIVTGTGIGPTTHSNITSHSQIFNATPPQYPSSFKKLKYIESSEKDKPERTEKSDKPPLSKRAPRAESFNKLDYSPMDKSPKMNIIDNYNYNNEGAGGTGSKQSKDLKDLDITNTNTKQGLAFPYSTHPMETINTTLINIVAEMKESKMNHFDHIQQQTSMYLPMNTDDLDEELKLAEEGYMEEDDEDLKSSNMSGGFFGLDDDDKYTFKFNQDEMDKSHEVIVDKSVEAEKKTIAVKEDLEQILFPKSSFDINKDQTFFVKTNFVKDVEVIEENLMVVILTFLYQELHNGVIELSDNLLEERRKYFKSNFDTYLEIVKFYLKSKEDFFMGVLSQIMSKLSISQQLLDHTLNYYMNEAEDTPKVIEIKQTYEKVYKAGEKHSIAPKVITKFYLKKILHLQLETFTELIQTYPQLSNDVMEIIVTDKVYSEFGFDKDAIRAAITKHDIVHDKAFEEILLKLEDFRNSSFLNI